MMTIHKYPFAIDDAVIVRMPAGAEILHIDVQNNQPCIWARVDPVNPLVQHKYQLRGTGHDASGLGPHLASFQMHGGALVFHMFYSN